MTTGKPHEPERPTPSPSRQPVPLPPHPSEAYEQGFGELLRKKRSRLLRRRLVLVGGFVLVLIAAGVAFLVAGRSERPEGLRGLAEHYGKATGLDPALVLAVIEVESNGRADAVSRAGARGLMQLMPRTADEVARKAGVELASPDDLFDPDLNVRLGTLYLAELRRLFGDDPWLYLAAYNAGMGRVRDWQRKHPGLSSRQLIEGHAFAETRAYVPRVLRAWDAAKEP